MSFFIRNLTDSSIEIDDLGLTLEASSDLDLTQEPAYSIATSDELVEQINSGNIVVLDPLDNARQLNVVDSVKCVQLANDPHYGIQAGLLDQIDDVNVPAPTHDYVLTYDLPSSEWQAKAAQGGGGPGGDSTSVREPVTQVGHGYATGQAVYFSGDTQQYELALANTVNTLATAVIEVTGLNTFDVVSDGDITTMTGLTAGEWYYVSDITFGAITTIEPSLFSNPVGYAESATKFHVVSIRAQDLTNTGGGGQPGISKKLVVQNAHGFNTGQPVYLAATGLYTLALADDVITLATAIVEIIDTNSFYLVDSGDVENMTGLVTGTWYYVSETVAGELTTTEPTTFSNPMGYADSATQFHVVSLRAQDLTNSDGGQPGISKKLIVQTAHGFNTGQPSYFDGTLWQLAQADNVNTLATVIIEVIDANSFYVVDGGDVEGMSGLVAGTWYYVDDSVPGTLTITEPTTFSNPMGYADSATQLHVVFARAIDLSGGIDPVSNKKIIIQNSHGFTTGQPIFFNGTIWQLAQADNINTLSTEVAIVIDVNTFEAIALGSIDGLSGLTPGAWYFVDDISPGTLVTTEPTISNPMGIAETTSKLFVIPMRAVDYTNV